MKQTLIALGAIALVGTAAILACNNNRGKSTNNEGIIAAANTTMDSESQVARGRYLVTLMGCNDCHSPKKIGPMGPEIDSAHMLSGHPAKMPIGKIDPEALKSWILFDQSGTAVVGPWGVSFSANLTSDASGIGNWTEEQFFTAIRKGKYKGMENGRPLLPPMPWPLYSQASDEDLRAIFAYLKSTQPVENVVPAPIAPPMLSHLP
ncbi:MAG: putative lipoprotein [Flaviaesturariibacter sp.]|nr:putative lipoprotein [Flaviaesturariibacter sp.]